MSFGRPQTPLTPEQLQRQQRVGLGLSALSDVFARRDPIANTLQRQAMLQAQQKQAQRNALLNELEKDPRFANQVKFIKAGLDPRLGERKIVKGADGYNYFADTGTRVLPGVEIEDSKEYGSAKDAAGYLRYTEGPQKGERVFPEVVVEKRESSSEGNNLKTTIEKSKKIPRNSPCTCGSGKKYKHCCGRAA